MSEFAHHPQVISVTTHHQNINLSIFQPFKLPVFISGEKEMDELHLNLVPQILVRENILHFNFLLALYSTSRESLPDSHGKGHPPRQAVELILDLSPPSLDPCYGTHCPYDCKVLCHSHPTLISLVVS